MRTDFLIERAVNGDDNGNVVAVDPKLVRSDDDMKQLSSSMATSHSEILVQ